MKHILICSMAHSGSTILNIALTSIPGALSLGEVDNTVRKPDSQTKVCTCGSSAPDCELWRTIFSGSTIPTLTEAYQRFYRGSASLIIDSSKGIHGVRALPAESSVDQRAIFLIKDVRGFLFSHLSKWYRKQSKPTQDVPFGPLLRPLFAFWQILSGLALWSFGNLKIYRGLKRSSIPFVSLGYEEMVLNPIKASQKLSQFLGEELNLERIMPNESAMHLVRGNRLKGHAAAFTCLKYDYRWMRAGWLVLLYPVLVPLVLWSRRWVYGLD
jgi:hypothetical protein